MGKVGPTNIPITVPGKAKAYLIIVAICQLITLDVVVIQS